jgi:uncharacterized protein (DUF697 family)
MGTNFHLAPPAKTVDGLLAVPIDIDAIDAVVTFDGAAQTGAASATITYTVGPTAGKGLDLDNMITTVEDQWARSSSSGEEARCHGESGHTLARLLPLPPP